MITLTRSAIIFSEVNYLSRSEYVSNLIFENVFPSLFTRKCPYFEIQERPFTFVINVHFVLFELVVLRNIGSIIKDQRFAKIKHFIFFTI